MKALIRDANILTEMNRELGIKDDGGAAAVDAQGQLRPAKILATRIPSG